MSNSMTDLPNNNEDADSFNEYYLIKDLLIGNCLNRDSLNGNSQNGDSIIGESLNGDSIIAESLNGDSIIGESLNADSIIGKCLNGDSIIAESLNGDSIIAESLNDDSIIGESLNGDSIIGESLNGDSIIGESLNADSIIAESLKGDSIIDNSLMRDFRIDDSLIEKGEDKENNHQHTSLFSHRSILPERKVLPTTKTAPFSLLVNERGISKKASFVDKMTSQFLKNRKDANFMASKCNVIYRKPFKIDIASKQRLVSSHEFKFATKEREHAWVENKRETIRRDNRLQMALKTRSMLTENMNNRVIKRNRQISESIKAHGIRKYKPISIHKSRKKTTIPLSPNFSKKPSSQI